MLNFNDWCKKDKEDKGYTLTKSSSGLPLFVLDNPFDNDDESVLLDDEPAKKKKTIPQQVSDYITKHFWRDNMSVTIKQGLKIYENK